VPEHPKRERKTDLMELCEKCHRRSTRFPGAAFCNPCHDTTTTTTDRYEAFRDENGLPIHVDGCGCTACTGGRHDEAPTFYADGGEQ
jgi:hypothetical protein